MSSRMASRSWTRWIAALAILFLACEPIPLKSTVTQQVGALTPSDTTGTLAAPTISPATNTYSSDQTVIITTGLAGAVIHYTTDGTNPTAASPVYSGSFVVAGSGTVKTIKAIVIRGSEKPSDAAVSVITINYQKVSTPVISGATSAALDHDVTISCATPGATVYYTIDGGAPTSFASSTSAKVTIVGPNTTKTIRAYAVKAGLLDSDAASGTFSTIYVLAPPVITPGTGSYSTDQLVTLTSTDAGTAIHYTIDKSDPTGSSPTYSTPISVAGDKTNITIKAIATKPGYVDSAISTAVIAINLSKVSTPTITGSTNSPTDQNVVIACATSGATVYYTINDPAISTSSSHFDAPATVPVPVVGPNKTVTIRAFAQKAGMVDSDAASGTFSTVYVLSAPTITPGSGTYSSDQAVTLSSPDAGTTIHYTLDGSAPSASSPSYSSALAVAGSGTTKTIRALATKPGYVDSAASSATLTITYPQVNTPSISPTSGVYSTDQAVTITCGTPGSTIYYTTDGSTPSSSSAVYSSSIPIAGSGTAKTIKALASHSGYQDSAVASQTITITYPVLGAPTFTPAGGTYTFDQLVTLGSSTSAVSPKMYYTLDNSNPTTSSPFLDTSLGQRLGLFGSGTSVTVMTFGTAAGYQNSPLGTASYTITYPSTGKIETLAGISASSLFNGEASAGSTDGAGTAARFNGPQAMTADGSGNLYVCDTVNNVIRMIDTAGNVTTLAGGGHAATLATANGLGSAATFKTLAGISYDATSGALFVADSGFGAIRSVGPGGYVSTVFSGAPLVSPTSVVAYPDYKSLYVTDAGPNNNKVYQILTAGIGSCTPLVGAGPAGSSDGGADTAYFNHPTGIQLAYDYYQQTNFFILTDLGNRTIRKVSLGGYATTLLGTGSTTLSSANSPLTPSAVQLSSSFATAVYGTNLYVVDSGNHQIAQYSIASFPSDVPLYTLMAGSGQGYLNGALGQAKLNNPAGVVATYHMSLKVYVADQGNQAIRVITPTP